MLRSTGSIFKGKLSTAELNKLIEKKAYELFTKRNHSHGNDRKDWFEAEKLVKKQYGVK